MFALIYLGDCGVLFFMARCCRVMGKCFFSLIVPYGVYISNTIATMGCRLHGPDVIAYSGRELQQTSVYLVVDVNDACSVAAFAPLQAAVTRDPHFSGPGGGPAR